MGYRFRSALWGLFWGAFRESEFKGKGGEKYLKEITVRVDDNDLERALRILKKKIQNDGLFKRLRMKKNYEKPSEYRRRKKREALRRQRIALIKKKAGFRRR